MARSLFSDILQAARAAEREANAQAHRAARRAREAERLNHKAYVEQQALEVFQQNEVLDATIEELTTILTSVLGNVAPIHWDSLLQHPSERELDADPSLILPSLPTLTLPKPPHVLASIFPGAKERYDWKVAKAEEHYLNLQKSYNATLTRRQLAMAAQNAKADGHNAQISEFRDAYHAGRPDAVAAYVQLILDRSRYPESFPKETRIAFVPESRQVVIDYRLPTIADAIPTVEKYRHVKASNQIAEVKKTEKARHTLYTNLVAQIVLRSLYETFIADSASVVAVIAFNAYVEGIDPGTGRSIKPYLVSVRATREEFAQIEPRQVDPVTCLKRLSAVVSRSPAELTPVKPIVDISMSDPRFVQEMDVLSTLDQRPNLMELTWSEFESLITNLFHKMGLETRLTQPSRDGGVDCVAFDQRPILGGKVIIQAKRYKNTVGVSAVRDLFGTIHNEGASKGILVTTSGYGTAAHTFANGKPIELLSGSHLLHLLKEHAGLDAKIEIPQDWADPQDNG